jgi:hypothetical protein
MRRAVFALTTASVIILLMLTIAQVTVVTANPFTPRLIVRSPSPLPTVYESSNVQLSFELNIENSHSQIDAFSCILDYKARTYLNFKTSPINMTVWTPGPPLLVVEGTRYLVSEPLQNLANGNHTLKVYAHFSNGTVTSIVDTRITVDTNYVDPLLPVIVSPLNQTTYNTTQVPLIYTTNNKVLWSYYSLDGSDLSYFEGNITLPSLSEGQHELTFSVVYNLSRTDSTNEWYTTQKMNSVTFYVDDVAPKITNVSIDSTDTSNLLLNFTVDENTSWAGYSLDNQANVTINGNAILRDLPNGVHNITVYAKDAAGNVGVSEMLFFSVGTSDLNAAIPDLYTIIAIIAIVIAVISTGLFVYFRRTMKG